MGAHGQLVALLWHHGIYYKRHWMLTIWEILKPILVLAISAALFAKSDSAKKGFDGKVFVHTCKYPLETLATHPKSVNTSLTAVSANLKLTPTTGVIKCENMGELTNNNNNNKSSQQKINTHYYLSCSNEQMMTNPICLLLHNDILLYPNNKDTGNLRIHIDKLRQQVTKKVRARNLDPEKNFNASTRVFNDWQELNKFVKQRAKDVNETNSTAFGTYNNNKHLFIWGAVSFEEMPKNLKEHVKTHAKGKETTEKDFLKYSVIRPEDEGESEFKNSYKIFALQDMIDWALLKTVSSPQTRIVPTLYKSVEEKCWKDKAGFSRIYVHTFIVFFCVAAFISTPSVFLSQILLEKQLKLREYLAIMGVNPLMLKFSWVLFYSLWLIPLSTIFAFAFTNIIMVDRFAMTTHFFVYFLLIGYNINMLAFCYMLSNFFQTNKYSSTFLYLIHMIIAVCTLMLGAGMSPALVWISRLLSLHPIIPMAIGIQYIGAWEDFNIGANWSNLAYSPVFDDKYGGLLEAFLWTVIDFWVYMFLAWYLEKVFPGEFGQKQPFYFPFSPKYWKPEAEDDLNSTEEINADVEPAPNKTPGVIIDDLTKTYGGGQKIALNKLKLVFYENEITVFLGHNGAGKSTTMNILVGLINPSSGKATVNGFDINTHMHKIRPQLGYVPQYDILYPDFTVEEQLKFFGWIKGLSTEETETSVNPVIESMAIGHLKKQTITNLSGGQKRKLSIITGYLGNPKTIIFDEPTSGVDPFSRRSIWETLLKHKSGCTTVLSTHFMDEADLLGDRIAIINGGQLKSSGTPIYLKNKYGRGFRLDVTRKENVAKETIVNFITGLVPDAKLNQELGVDMEFSLSKETLQSPEMIHKMESIEANPDIVSYGINEPNIEDVFFSSIKQDHLLDPQTKTESQVKEGGKHSNEIEYEKAQSFGNQFLGLTKKRFISSLKGHFLLVQNGIPLMFIILMSLIGMNNSTNEMSKVKLHHPGLDIALFLQAPDSQLTKATLKSAFETGNPMICPGYNCYPPVSVPSNMVSNPSKTAIPNKCSDDKKFVCQLHCKNYEEAEEKVPHGVLPSGETLYRLSTENKLAHWIVLANQSNNVILGGFTFEKEVNAEDSSSNTNSTENSTTSTVHSDYTATVHYQLQVRMAMVNLWNSYRLRQVTGTSLAIEVSIKEENVKLYDFEGKRGRPLLGIVEFLTGSLLLVIAFTFVTFGVIYDVSLEKTSGLKRLQLLNGASPLTYWLSNLLHDYLHHLLTSLVVTLPLLLFESTFSDDIGALILVVLVWGLQSITFVYLLMHLFNSSTGVINLTMLLGFLSAIVTLISSLLDIVKILAMCMENTQVFSMGLFNTVFSAVPIYQLGMQINYLASLPFYSLLFGTQCNSGLEIKKQCEDACNKLDKTKTLAPFILGSLAWAVFYFIIVLLFEYFDVAQRLNCFEPNYPSAPVTDFDVVKEEQRLAEAKGDDNLIVNHLKKCFKVMKRPAVSDISFGVHKGETFGLLGINGAGKSTTFNMLTGFHRPTSGSASIMDVDLFSSSWTRFGQSSYCPQENTLFPSLTIEQHLSLFGALRGISPSPLEEVAEALIMEVGLDDHRGKKAGQLSGGNQRKLQLAIALMDYKPVIFLDEPTSGMDPGARRKTWNCVGRAVKQGCSVVLTSHSMEECEALCHRLVIMVDGAFTCIGSVDYLKHKFGDKIILNIKVEAQGVESGEIEKVRDFVTTRLPNAILKDQHSAMLQFHVQRSQDFPLSKVHNVMQQMKSALKIEDVSVKSTSLEQVFINMARAQEDKEKGVNTGSNLTESSVTGPNVTESSVTGSNVTESSGSQPQASPV